MEALEERLLLTGISDGSVAEIVEIPNPIPTVYPISGGAFGASVTSIGDLNGDGIADLAVGSPMADSDIPYVGAVQILFMNADGTVQKVTTIGNQIGGGPALRNGSGFGSAVTSMGDLDGDGNVDLAVGANHQSIGGFRPGERTGAVYILYLNSDGTAKSSVRMGKGTKDVPRIRSFSNFGSSLASMGDLNGDGVTDLAVGAWSNRKHHGASGQIDILLMNADGTVKSSSVLFKGQDRHRNEAGFNYIGITVANVGDINGDGITDLAASDIGDSAGGVNRGAVYIAFLNRHGNAKSFTRIAGDENGGPAVGDNEHFGVSVSGIGDLDGDGIGEIAVGDDGPSGTTGTYETGIATGAIHILFLNADGSVKSSTRFSPDVSDNPGQHLGDRFGASIAPAGDLNGDGITELAVGASGNGNASYYQGALHILYLNSTEQGSTIATN